MGVPSSARGRFAILLAACTLSAIAAIVIAARSAGTSAGSPPAAAQALARARAEKRPVVVFRSLDRGSPGSFGQLALANLRGSTATRTRQALRCERVYFGPTTGLCLTRGNGFAEGYRAQIVDTDLRIRNEIDIAGIPSRARVSPDGRYGSVTSFVTGHSYAEAGAFSTQTTLIDLARGTTDADLEQFTTYRGSRQVTALDVNFWGVTFARDSDRFYATLATGGKTYLVEGSVADRTMRTIHENVECPSLAPGGRWIAYKKRVDGRDGPWRLFVLDLQTMRETPLAETRSVDDQAEWLDDHHLLYVLHDEIWIVPSDGSGRPIRFMPRAESPTVARW
ncbi:MAG TPA: hypothetical protein VGO80_05805 [Solirubrobacteraceae bacterium]|jgi:hypothetical protein|nr:hypothetical protein [Solirubrobacteraceae bacterium]